MGATRRRRGSVSSGLLQGQRRNPQAANAPPGASRRTPQLRGRETVAVVVEEVGYAEYLERPPRKGANVHDQHVAPLAQGVGALRGAPRLRPSRGTSGRCSRPARERRFDRLPCVGRRAAPGLLRGRFPRAGSNDTRQRLNLRRTMSPRRQDQNLAQGPRLLSPSPKRPPRRAAARLRWTIRVTTVFGGVMGLGPNSQPAWSPVLRANHGKSASARSPRGSLRANWAAVEVRRRASRSCGPTAKLVTDAGPFLLTLGLLVLAFLLQRPTRLLGVVLLGGLSMTPRSLP